MDIPSILYIEDEPDYQVLVSGILAEAGLHTETADTGDEGLDRLTRKKPSLLLLDVNLPDTSGYTLCSRIRQEEAWSEIPIMMLTVRRRPNEWLEGFSNGADDYLPKPFNPPELIERVQTILAGKLVRKLNPSDPEHLLIEAALAGNRPAFQVLITRYKEHLQGYVRQSVHDPSAVEDIVSGSFAQAYQYLDRFRGDATFFTWLYTIADNYIRRHHNYQNRLAPQHLDDSLEELIHIPRHFHNNRADAAAPEAIQMLRKAVRRLPDECKQPLKLHYLRGVPVAKIASRLSIPLGTVLTRMLRGKKLLRATFENHPMLKDL